MGEELLAQGDIRGGTEHLANAVAVCAQPHQLLQFLQSTLPPEVFHLVLQRLPTTEKVSISKLLDSNNRKFKNLENVISSKKTYPV